MSYLPDQSSSFWAGTWHRTNFYWTDMQQHNPSFQNPMKRLLLCTYPLLVSCFIKCKEKMLFKSATRFVISKLNKCSKNYKTYFLACVLRRPVVTHSINSSIRYDGARFVISQPSNGKFGRITSFMTSFPFSLDPNEVK